jgi:hypothetical protein
MGDRWVCIGHSHVVALAQSGDTELESINFWDTGDPWRYDGGATHLRHDLAERVLRGRRVLSLIGGSAHTVLGMVEHPRPFDLIVPSAPDLPLDETRELIPADAVRAKLSEMSEPYLAMLPAVARLCATPLVHIGPPPPVAAEDRIAPHVPWILFPGQPHAIAPKWVRYKLWRVHCEVIAAICTRLDIQYVPAPERSKDEEGFLHPDYDRDGAHANASYGALVLEELRGAI